MAESPCVSAPPSEASVNGESPDFRLLVQTHEANQAVIPLRWCASKKLAEKIAEDDVAQNGKTWCSVLIAQTDAAGKEIVGGRQLVDFNEAMTYVQFRKPGANTVHAWLLCTEWASNRYGEGGWESRYLSRWGYSYDFKLFDTNGKAYTGYKALGRDFDSDFEKALAYRSTAVTVDAQFFAKTPPDWLKRWVNAPYDSEPVDQCQFRRRMLFAFTLQPFAVGWLLALRSLIFLWLILWGMRDIPWGKFFNLRLTEGVMYEDPEERGFKQRSVFWTNAAGKNRYFLIWLFTPALVLAWILIAGGAFLIQNANSPENQYYPWRSAVLVGLATPFAFWLTLWAIILATVGIDSTWFLINTLINWVLKPLDKLAEKADAKTMRKVRAAPSHEEMREKKRLKVLEELEAVTCSPGPMPVDIRALPRRTVRLRYQRLKAALCRPFAQ